MPIAIVQTVAWLLAAWLLASPGLAVAAPSTAFERDLQHAWSGPLRPGTRASSPASVHAPEHAGCGRSWSSRIPQWQRLPARAVWPR